MNPRALLVLFVLTCAGPPRGAMAQSSPDTTHSAASGTVLLTDGRSYDVIQVRPSTALGSVRIRSTDGRTQYLNFNRVRTITAADGTDWTRRVLEDGKTLGRDWKGEEIVTQARKGSWDLGTDFTILSSGSRAPWETVGQATFHAGVYLSRSLEIEPAASVIFAGLPALEMEISELLHVPTGSGHGHPYVRLTQGEYFVTPGKSGAGAWGASVGFETPGGPSSRGRIEVGYLHISEGPDIGGAECLTIRFGFNSLKNAR